MDSQQNIASEKGGYDAYFRMSSSVQSAFASLPEFVPVTSWELVQGVLQNHYEYGNYLGEKVLRSPGPKGGEQRLPQQWMEAINGLFDPAKVDELHGRLLILGLGELDPVLAKHLERMDFLTLLRKELKEPFEELLRSEPQTPEKAADAYADYAVFHPDAATAVDRLGRRAFADAMAIWLSRIWRDNNREKNRDRSRRLPEGNSFVVHLHGAWGSGKTSLLKLLETSLSKTPPKGAPAWKPVWYNAWRNRHIEPVWWPLLDAICRDVSKRRPILKWREHWWRLRINGLFSNPAVIGTFALMLTGMMIVALGARLDEGLWNTVAAKVGGAVAFLGLAGTLGTGLLNLNRALFSASSAQDFMKLGSDPMEKIRRHFHAMMDRVGHPVMVFIDDLDRCHPACVVGLLESMQTLFNDPRVFYVVAADRRWLYECFELVYKDFRNNIREPGRRTGYLFLEKIFQLSVSVPNMSPERQREFLDSLYRGANNTLDEQLQTATDAAEQQFATANTTDDLVNLLTVEKGLDDTVQMQARREAAVRRLASQEVSTDIEHFLLPFSPLLERNPRAMKRLVNAYSVYLALALLSDVQLISDNERKKQFALWCILSLRWPALAEGFEQHPEWLTAFLQKRADGFDADMKELFEEEEVHKTLNGATPGVEVRLELTAVQRIMGLQSAVHHPASA